MWSVNKLPRLARMVRLARMTRMFSSEETPICVDKLGVTVNKTSSNEELKQAVIANFAALEFADMSNILDQLRTTMLKHPMHPAYTVSSRAPTKEEISRAPIDHWRRNSDDEKNLLDNPDLFQMGVPYNVQYSHMIDYDDSEFTYSGEVKFSLFGLPGNLKQEYSGRIPAYSHQGFNSFTLLVQFKSADFNATLVNLKDVEWWETTAHPLKDFKVPDEPVLNLKLKELGLSDQQSKAVVEGLTDKFRTAFEGSGIECDVCELIFTDDFIEYVEDCGLL